MMEVHFEPFRLKFKNQISTSRGTMTDKLSYLVTVTDGQRRGIGECSLLSGLSPDKMEYYDDFIDVIKMDPELFYHDYKENDLARLQEMPSIRFGLEMAFKDLDTDNDLCYFNSDFNNGLKPIPINGLIWMGDRDFIYNQINEKISAGWTCIKLKIGQHDFKQEIDQLKYIRSQYSDQDIELRLDANGAFTSKEAIEKIKQLSDFNIHSIEQPIGSGHWELMSQLCELSPIDIALDEELIGVYDEEQDKLLETIQPAYIICKPSLLGGWFAADQWINKAKPLNIGWWATSALESNIGLNAIAQWTATKDTVMNQGLGTGSLYGNNIDGPLMTEPNFLRYNSSVRWEIESLKKSMINR